MLLNRLEHGYAAGIAKGSLTYDDVWRRVFWGEVTHGVLRPAREVHVPKVAFVPCQSFELLKLLPTVINKEDPYDHFACSPASSAATSLVGMCSRSFRAQGTVVYSRRMGQRTRAVAGKEVTVSSPDKLYFPKLGLTKSDVIDYFLAVSGPLLESLGRRPVLLQRFPNGVGGKSFFQKRIPDGAPAWLQTTTVETINGTTSRALVLADEAHLVWAVNLGAFTIHPWAYRVPLNGIDELRIDLDPVPGIGFEEVREAAFHTHDFFRSQGITSVVKTSGSKGLHVYVALAPGWDSMAVRGAAVTVARRLAALHPELLTDRWWKEERGQRVFVDFNQNAPHKTVFGAWSVRARVGAQVSTPVTWAALQNIDPESLTIETVPQRLASDGDPWAGIYDAPQQIDDLVAEFTSGLETVGDAPWPPVYPKQPFEPPRVSPSRAKPT